MKLPCVKLLLRLWSNKLLVSGRESAQSRMTITGHQAEIVCVQISGELGIIVSASKGSFNYLIWEQTLISWIIIPDSRCLIHTIQGELLRTLLLPTSYIDPYRLLISREGYILLVAKPCFILLYTINGRPIGYLMNSDENMVLRTNLEAVENVRNYEHNSISAMALSKEGDYVILASDDGFVRVRRCHSLELVHCYPRCDAAITSLAVTTDQRYEQLY